MTRASPPQCANTAGAKSGSEDGEIEGFVDIFSGHHLAGWAHDRSAPGRRLRIEIITGDDVLTVTADEERKDVAAAGRNDGFCGFSVALHPDAAGRDLIHVREASTGMQLAGSPIDPIRNRVSPMPPPCGIEGYIDFVDGNRIVGWIHDRTIPGRRLKVTVSAGNLTVTLVADQFRQDVAASGLNDGYCGFEFAFDRRAVGKRLIHVREASLGLELGGSPFRPDLLNRIATVSNGRALDLLRTEAVRILSTASGGRS